jgi:hypothetical protein
MQRRSLPLSWVAAAVNSPDRTTSDPDDPALTRSYKAISEAGNRILRVVHRPEGADILVITAHFDRGASP